MLYGHDISNYQGVFNWDQVRGTDGFSIAKATEGTTFTDAQFARNWERMKAYSLMRGAYHFGHPNLNAVTQASYFVNVVKGQGLTTDDALVLDLETTDGLGPSAVAAWARTFCDTVQAQTGKNTWVYTNHAFISNGCCSGLYGRPLWIASPAKPGQPGDVRPWPVWSVHQYGISAGVDVDVLNGDAGVWAALVNAPAPAPKWKLARYVTKGTEVLSSWSASVGQLPSTTLRITCENSPEDLFAPNLAGWLNALFEGQVTVNDPMPKGVALYYMAKAS